MTMRHPRLLVVTRCSSPWPPARSPRRRGIREVMARAQPHSAQHEDSLHDDDVLPEDEEILDVVCGDKDFWVISATQNIAHVKPAKEGAATNLNLVTASGNVYSFLLHRGQNRARRTSRSTSPRIPTSSGQAEVLFRHPGRGPFRRSSPKPAPPSTAPTAESTRPSRRSNSSIRRHLQFVYGAPKYEKPFLVRRSGTTASSRTSSRMHSELPALYEVKDGQPAVGRGGFRGGP